MEITDSTCMEHLVKELSLLLKLLENESVSSATAEKMCVVRNLVKQLQPSVNGSDFLYMNTSLYGNGTSFVESLFEEFGQFLYLSSDCDLQELRDSSEEIKDVEQKETSKHLPKQSSPTDTPPPLPTTPPPDDYYEEAVPLGPGTMPQYITTRSNSSPPNSIEDAYYEDADNNYPTTHLNGASKNSYNDSDALSSSYESYDEEDEEAKGKERMHQWPSEESPVGQMKDCRKCAFMLRKKRFGQWAKQLTIIRENRLQCFKNPKDRSPHVDIPLNLCNVIYVPKDGRRKKHELRFSIPGGEALVLAVQSKEQAESWLKVIQEVCNLASNTNGKESSSSPMILRKLELEKMMSPDKHTSDSDSGANGDITQESCENGKGRKGTFSELTGSMSRAAGRKINRIISFSKKKPPLPCETNTFSHLDDNPRCGYLNVLVNQCWKECWCSVRNGTLYLHKDRGDIHTHVNFIALHGVEVLPGLGPKHPFAFRIMRGSTEVAALEASCSVEMGRWLGVLLAEAGSATTPEALHYDYVDVDTISSIQNAARHSFLWATSSSSVSTDPRTYDEVPYESVLVDETQSKLKRYSSMSSVDTAKVDTQVIVKRHGSSVNHNRKYGKIRAEEDARRYLTEKEQLEKVKEIIRKSLLSLRREKKEVKERLKDATVCVYASDKHQKAMEQQLAQLEESCRQKEAERVDLELRLTEVKEKLKKSLTGGILGAPVELAPIKVSVKKKEHVYSDTTLPVNCSSEIKKRSPSIYASTKGNVMQKAKEWESKKGM
ncbi:actin filament-associated protein 1-like 1 isoform X2 [Myxocyprinus asiaticus]|uniref:actin filament-associated protein 1-like 1 isoform X2 n=1 Tax=Myxocyprinus asiaticus TaxID=70543 RepID=UPI002221B5FC|nr:actin filament-associated protein 1-like 1 isoform X2 [Myxocyprinus asiaticus]